MFVLDALFLTFCTTPVVSALYPPHRRIHVSTSGHPISKGIESGQGEAEPKGDQAQDLTFTHKTRFTVLLDKFDHVPGVMSMSQLLSLSTNQPNSNLNVASISDAESMPSRKERLIMTQPVSVTALRLLELTDRTSALMKSSRADALAQTDPLLKIFRTIGDLNESHVSNELSVVPLSSFGRVAGDSARGFGSDLVVTGWAPASSDAQHSDGDGPFDHLLRSTSGVTDTVAASAASQIIRGVFKDAATDVALFMDQRQFSTESYGHKHLFMPFFGGVDDRTALQLVVQLCLNPRLTATVVRLVNGPALLQKNPLTATTTSESQASKSASGEVAASGFTIHAVSNSITSCIFHRSV